MASMAGGSCAVGKEEVGVESSHPDPILHYASPPKPDFRVTLGTLKIPSFKVIYPPPPLHPHTAEHPGNPLALPPIRPGQYITRGANHSPAMRGNTYPIEAS